MRRALLLACVAACGQPIAGDDSNPADLPLGDRLAEDEKADGNWGAALTCKPAPSLPALVSPRIVISLDGLTLYARTKSAAKTPVPLQREPERLADGTRTDVASKWVGAECGADSDCNFAGGLCAYNAYSDRGFCTTRCTSTCADKAGQPG